MERSNILKAPKLKQSFIEVHRREQIIDTAIETIATRGYHETSLADIANNAGISKGVIPYYFNSKEELIEEIKSILEIEWNSYVKLRVEAQTTASEKMRAYVDSFIEYAMHNRNKFLATADLWINLSSKDEGPLFSRAAYREARRHIKRILRIGQERGEFKPFPLEIIATIIQGVIDGVLFQWIFDPEAIDFDECRQRIFEMIEGYINKRG